MTTKAEIMKRVCAEAEKNLRPVAEMVVANHRALIDESMASSDVASLIEDITACLVGVYEAGVERQAKAVAAASTAASSPAEASDEPVQ